MYFDRTDKPRGRKFNFTPAQNIGKYNDLEKYFEVQRMEHEAARSIQRIWRSSRVLLPWRYAVMCTKMAQRIQKIARGMLVRKWVAEWFFTRNNIVITWQAHARRYVSNKHLRPELEIDFVMTTKIQCLVRCRQARRKCDRILDDMAATRIQTLWRGCVGRLSTDKMWLNLQVIPLQNWYRKRLAQRRFASFKTDYFGAALVIQKKFRNWYSRKLLANALFAREMDYRYSNIRMLTGEEEMAQEYLSKAMERLVKGKLKEAAEEALKRLIAGENEVYKQENDLTEFKLQAEVLSSRARKQGFDLELAKNIADTRVLLTNLKIKVLFDLAPAVFQADEVLVDQVRDVEEWAALRNKVNLERNDQYDERRHLNYKRDLVARHDAKRIAIAEEKRRWGVRFFTSDGKPDKKRRPGRPWDASIFAGANKMTYTGGTVNLMAHIEAGKRQKAGQKGGTVESVEATLGQVGLQTYLEEINLYERLMEPISKIMQKTMGVTPMGASNLEEQGWGLEGAKMVPALLAIDAIEPAPPAPTRSSRTAGTRSVSFASEIPTVYPYPRTRTIHPYRIRLSTP
eukprot:CAMPEP_0173332308 /NCGR_PEP_ID=MMETSP1144-20121109/4289_1 /TAXON_ID=483371 /ORGANISM="non described non described, Strain CCMP2298" /LENGTH=569 /DNA_ID=CAMNT_0014277195 /DNA_START=142 /DNA_END=1848 /DNA_ORIENTATION=+